MNYSIHFLGEVFQASIFTYLVNDIFALFALHKYLLLVHNFEKGLYLKFISDAF